MHAYKFDKSETQMQPKKLKKKRDIFHAKFRNVQGWTKAKTVGMLRANFKSFWKVLVYYIDIEAHSSYF